MKLLTFLIALTMFFSFSACKSEEKNSSEDMSSDEATCSLSEDSAGDSDGRTAIGFISSIINYSVATKKQASQMVARDLYVSAQMVLTEYYCQEKKITDGAYTNNSDDAFLQEMIELIPFDRYEKITEFEIAIENMRVLSVSVVYDSYKGEFTS